MIMCLDDSGDQVVIKGICRLVLIRYILAMEGKKYIKMGFQLYIIHVEEIMFKKSHIEYFLLLQEYEYFFKRCQGCI